MSPPLWESRFKKRPLPTTGRGLVSVDPALFATRPATLPVSAPRFREGELFDDTYRLIRLLGEGAMGAVYEATHARLAGRYAIKVLLLKPTVNSEALTLFSREARITSLLQHPNIVQVIDHNTTSDGTEYLVMEYLHGESLAQRLQRQGALSLETVVGIVNQIAAGLAAAHAYRIVHCDLKPDNVFLVPVQGREEESVKILDFGISKVKGGNWGRQAPEGTVMGTPLYMAPEQIEGRIGDADAATDQFALAIMAYEMLTGRNPFQGSSVTEIFTLVLATAPPPMGLGGDIELVVRRGLSHLNSQRFPSITDFSEALGAAATGRKRDSQWAATLAYAAGEVASHENKGRSNRRLVRTVLSLAGLASLVGAFVLGGRLNYYPAEGRAIKAAPDLIKGVLEAQVASEAEAGTRAEGKKGATIPPEEEPEAEASREGSAPTAWRPSVRHAHRKATAAPPLPEEARGEAPPADEDATLAPSE